MLRSWDPRLNPALDPKDWAAVARLNRLRLIAALSLLASVLAGVAAFFWYPVDRTRDLTPEAVVEKAGLALLQAGYYRFRVDLTGKAAEYPFPDTSMTGEYRREPQVLHLKGNVLSGETRVELEYWVAGSDLYLHHPTLQRWLKVPGVAPEELASFYPENLAAPLVGGVRRVEVVGPERLPDGPAMQYRLELDPSVMLPNSPELQNDRTEYRLWVYTRTLKPARFTVQVARQQGASDSKIQTSHFAYQLAWDFRGAGDIAVPESVVRTAEEVGAVPELPGNLDGPQVTP